MNRMRRIVVGAVIGVVCLGAAACSSGGGSAAPASTTTTTNPPTLQSIAATVKKAMGDSICVEQPVPGGVKGLGSEDEIEFYLHGCSISDPNVTIIDVNAYSDQSALFAGESFNYDPTVESVWSVGNFEISGLGLSAADTSTLRAAVVGLGAHQFTG